MAWGPCAKGVVLLTLLFLVESGHGAVIASGIKLKVSQVKAENNKTFFNHKKRQLVYSGNLNIIQRHKKSADVFFTFEELKNLLRENKIALGGVAGGGGGK
ncbi:MAG: hypothetical protein A2X86_12060 [Bdellovibrionales bacterium GWA2_49_15]|nr:MAG: hypothetical protein A2X86_12060 [Bdellovibrionales bacterium GWA2_49_15]